MSGRYDNAKRNQYNSTPRKVFDKAIDRQDVRLARHKEDHRADVNALLQRLNNVEKKLTQLLEEQHMQQEGEFQTGMDLIQLPDGRWGKRSTEGL